METLAHIIEKHKTDRRNELTGRCCAQLTAACKAGGKLDAVIFLYTTLCYGLKMSKSIVDDVRDNNMTFTQAYNSWIMKD